MGIARNIKVLIVDDSALVRQTLSVIISSIENMEVCGTASDPYIAVELMKNVKPDVITLDIQMPRMDGITFLKKIMTQHPLPVVIISSLTSRNSKLANDAYKLGAINVIEKPVFTASLHEEWKKNLSDTLRAAASSNIMQRSLYISKASDNKNKTKIGNSSKSIDKIIMIGSSAGGTEVVNYILANIKKTSPPVLIVQHMPELFTTAYAERLNTNTELDVREAVSGDTLYNGLALITPGNKHMEIRNNGTNFFVDINSSPKVNRHRPSVDVLFNSAIVHKGIGIMSIILSGMGNDGALSMLRLKKMGATTIAQSPESCIVFGMPKEAIETNAATLILSPDKIVEKINHIK